MFLLSCSILLYTAQSASNYIIDTPPDQVDDHHDPVNWAYPIDVCMPNHLIFHGITAHVKYECKKNDNTDTYSVIKKSYAFLDHTCTGEIINTKTFASDTKPNRNLPGYFVCGQQESEYAIINIFDNDPTCQWGPYVALYTAIGIKDDLCFNDRGSFVSSFECFYDKDSRKDSYVKQMIYVDDQCEIPMVGWTLTKSSCQVLGSMTLTEDNGGQTIIYGSHTYCKCNDDNVVCGKHTTTTTTTAAPIVNVNVTKEYDLHPLENIFNGGDNSNEINMDSIVAGIGFVASMFLYGILFVFLIMNGVFCWCYLYPNKNYQ